MSLTRKDEKDNKNYTPKRDTKSSHAKKETKATKKEASPKKRR